ncbi:MATE family efflux transporter [Adhaeribacter pallidiroseus]|uniref:Polysaccharide biosynthesis protein n=1 Tax=Adhaeribacter pallidiroseus TaxID=2072847 RepID=A0A369QV75_9BACT|nr:polysaccharide biosynthesis protein [Adhaeribacter pallidiroseus]RDC66088.1 hypothetical protein AHMF7616_04719 [Adhaeribacter pallidiroseus]
MKALVQSIYTNPKYARAIEWGRLLAITGGAQSLVQAISFVSGILVIRLLSTQEYAIYTLANTMLGTMTILADGGISTGVMGLGGKVWQDRERLGTVLATGLDLRRKFAAGSLLIAMPISIYLLLHNGASWLTTILIVASLVLAFFAALSDSILEIVPKLHQEVVSLQKNQIQVGLARVVLSGLTLFIFPWAFVAILASGIPRIYGNIQLRKVTFQFVTEAKPDLDISSKILSLVRKTMPGLIYYCVSSQLTIWLLSILGNTASIAQIGALGRISILLNILGVVFSTILVPRFARTSEGNKNLSKKFLHLLMLFIGLCILFISSIYFFSAEILWVLGSNYTNMNFELVLFIIGSCVFACAGFIYSLTSSRGFVLSPYIYITFSVLAIIIGIIIFDVSSLTGILYYNIFVSGVQLSMYTLYAYFKIIKFKY